MLDTGASITTLNLNSAKRILDFDANSPDAQQIGDIAGKPVYETRITSIEVEGVSIANPVVHVLPDLMGKATARVPIGSLLPQTSTALPSIILGMSALGKMHVYIAYKERKLYLTPAATEATVTPAAAPAP